MNAYTSHNRLITDISVESRHGLRVQSRSGGNVDKYLGATDSEYYSRGAYRPRLCWHHNLQHPEIRACSLHLVLSSELLLTSAYTAAY